MKLALPNNSDFKNLRFKKLKVRSGDGVVFVFTRKPMDVSRWLLCVGTQKLKLHRQQALAYLKCIKLPHVLEKV